MQIKIFDLSSRGSEQQQEELNKFLRGHKVLDIDRQFYVSSGNVGHWSIAVTYLPATVVSGQQDRREKVDYRELLSPQDFERFAKLRAIRKKLAADDAVPAYAVFTDAELAQIAKMGNVDATLVARISGIGEKRMEKYGKILCEMFNEQRDETQG
ncbi:MAG: HRDC domain-containing protein [Prevotella sp.]|nr:HRDC domain-containing protein [Prevotella sp.]